jgi:hypothetical protein
VPAFVTRSHVDKGFSTMPNALDEIGSRSTSGRAGGECAVPFMHAPGA